MPKFSNSIVLLLAALLLAACQGVSRPQPEPEVQPEPAIEASNDAGAAEVAEAVPEPEPVDLDQIAYEEAIEALKNGETGFALEILARLATDAPDKPRLFTNIGLAHFRLEQPEAAEAAFEQAIRRDPDDAVAHNHLGILKRQKGEFNEALAAYQKALEIDVNYARAHLNLGILFDLYLQNLEKALQHYRKYQELTSEENELVAGWIVDIERRLKNSSQQTQG